MSSEPSWPAPGIECVCITDFGWRDLRSGPFSFIVHIGPRPGPEFMQQYKILDLYLHEADQAGHRLKLIFAEYPSEVYCACMFRPLEKIEDKETKNVTAPVDELVN